MFAAAATLVLVEARTAFATIDVWVDPGHGNYDTGTPGIDGPSLPNEANLTMPTSEWLFGWLESFGYTVALTRNGEGNPTTWLKPRVRTRILNGLDPNDLTFRDSSRIIISIHMDAACNKKGVCDSTQHKTTSYWNPKAGEGYSYNFSQSFALALTVHPYVDAEADISFLPCRGDGGVQIGDFFMIRDVHAPAMLVEVCKLTNRCQFNLIQDDGVQSQMAYAIASGVTHYMDPGGAPVDPELSTPAGLAAAIAHASGRGSPIQGFRLPMSVSTRSAAVTASFQEGFDAATFPPTGWARMTSGAPAPHNWNRTTDALIVQSGAGAAISIGQYASASDEWLVSPMIRVSPGDTGLSFYWAGNSALASAANATCQIRRKGEVPWTQVWSLVANEPLATAFVYRERVVNLASFAGDSIQFAFRVQGTSGPDFAVDDVAVGAFPPTGQPSNDQCDGAAALPAGSFTLHGVTCYASNDVSPAFTTLDCLPDEMDGRDVIYSIEALAGDTLSVAVAGDWNPGLYVIDACVVSPNCLIGQYPVDPGTSPAAFDYVFPTSGTYHLVIDGPADECGPYTLTGTFRGSVTAVDPPVSGASGISFAAHPNPTRGEVQFRGVVPSGAATNARITIVDLTGRRMISIEVPVAGGSFIARWNGHDSKGASVPAGIYFARLEVGAIVSRATLVLAR
jgi:N-acetylmuramoyl-L-alanine amidase